jgi:hypothetical protein
MVSSMTSPRHSSSCLLVDLVFYEFILEVFVNKGQKIDTLHRNQLTVLQFSFGHISNESRKDLDDLMGEPPGFFCTRVRRLLTFGLIGLILMKLE